MSARIGQTVRTPDGYVGYVVGKHKRRGILYASVNLPNGANYPYRADALTRAEIRCGA